MKTVLLVDDNLVQLTMREMVLRKAAIDCRGATSAQSALAWLRSGSGGNNIGAVITDHLMPGMDGVEFVKQFRSFNQETPVIVISGLPDADQEYAGLNVIFRLKPCDPEELIALIRKTMKNPSFKASA
ncbi:MAG TPA: response regulator [Candidatus Angelobacter sp.]